MADVNEIRERLRAREQEAATARAGRSSQAVEDVRTRLRQAEHHSVGADRFQEDLQRERTAQMENLINAADQGSFAEDSMMAARALIDGMWLNKAEEAGSWMAATAYKILNPTHDRSITEIRETMLGDLEAESAAFRERAPMTALTANVVGGIVSPVSLAGGQALQAGTRLRQGAQASQAVPAILGASDEAAMASQALARQMAAGGATAAPNALQSAVRGGRELAAQVAQRTPVVLQASALAGAEGAVFGYEGATAQEKKENAIWSGALSAAFPVGAAAIGKMWNGATSNRVAQELGEGKDFVNLSFTESKKGGGLAAGLYRHIVGKAFGAKGMIESQVNSLTGRIPKRREGMERSLDTAIRDAKSAMTNLKFVNSRNEEAVEKGARELMESAKQKATAGGRIAEDNIDTAYRDKINSLNIASGKTQDDISNAALLEADEAVNGLNADFRATTLLAALPREADEAADLVTTMHPQEALQYLDKVWEKFGFLSAKKKSYKVNVDGLIGSIEALAKKEPAIRSGLARNNSGVTSVTKTVKETLEQKMNKGLIKGDDLVELRSTIGRYINGLSEGAPEVKDFSNAVQDRIDNIILGQLDGAAAEAFKADRAIWAVKKVVDEASEIATGGTQLRQGAYNGEDWLAALKKRNKFLTARGKSILQKEAQEVADLSRARDKAIKEKADDLVKAQKDKLELDVQAMKEAKEAEKRALKDAYDAEIKQLGRDFKATKKDAASASAYNVKRLEAKQRWQQQSEGLDEQIKKLADDEKYLKSLGARGNVTIFEQAFASGALGAIFKPVVDGVVRFGSALATGVAVAPVLARQSTQRLIAGQTGAQRRAFAAGQQASRANQALSQSGAVPSLFGAQFQNVMNQDQ